MNSQEDIQEKEFSLNTVLVFPDDITEHIIEGKRLVIAHALAKWLVFNDQEYNAFINLKKGMTIGETLNSIATLYGNSAESIIQEVLIQIEEKKFYKDSIVGERKICENSTIYLTNGCNLRCKHCYINATKPTKDELKYSDWIDYIIQFRNNGGKVLTITGGEPMIKEFFLDFIIYAKELGFQIVLLTNGTLINNESYKIIGQACDEIQISIDGPDEKTHDSMRGVGTFNKSLASLVKLGACSAQLSIAMTPIPETLFAFHNKLSYFVNWVKQNIHDNVNVKVTPYLLEGRNINCLNPQEQTLFYQIVENICNSCIEEDYFDKVDAAALTIETLISGCGYAESLSVYPNGDVKACYLSTDIIGNIKNQGLTEIISKLNKLYSLHRVEKVSPCFECDLRYFCGGKCRVENLKTTGAYNASQCSSQFKRDFYEKLVRINQWVYEPLV